MLPSGLRLSVTTSGTQLDPVQEADTRFFERDRGCRKAGLRSAGFTNASGRRSSPPLRQMVESPAQGGGRAVPDGISAPLRHILIMRLLSQGYEPRDAGFWASPVLWEVCLPGDTPLSGITDHRAGPATQASLPIQRAAVDADRRRCM